MKPADLSGRRVGILGAGAEGRAALEVLGRQLQDPDLTVLDEQPIRNLPGAQNVRSGPLETLGLGDFDVIVRSPGFSIYRQALKDARRCGVRFTSGTSLWLGTRPGGTVIGVTGTKGKSTTTSLLGHLLTGHGCRVEIGGNFGLPAIRFLERPAADYYVVELSSYQIADLTGQVDLAVLTSLAADHLDWHQSLASYQRDKLRLLTLARSGVVAHCSLRERLQALSVDTQAISWAGSAAQWQVRGSRGQRQVSCSGKPRFSLDCWQLAGRHNLDNLEVALTSLAHCHVDLAEPARALAAFRPLPHRLQPVDLGAGQAPDPALGRDPIRCVNDSIATTPDATVAALACYQDQSVVLIAGGMERQQDWQVLAERLATQPVKRVVVQGAGGARLLGLLREQVPGQALTLAASLDEAVALALAHCVPGGVVLLSPGAPSFDQFRDYAARGERFETLCRQHVSSEASSRA